LNEEDPERKMRCILVMYGLPLKVASPRMTGKERREAENLEERKESMRKQLEGNNGREKGEAEEIKKQLQELNDRIDRLKKSDQGASLDSEIALVLRNAYPLSKWIPNPFFAGYRGKEIKETRENVLMVSRLDGPSGKVVRRVIEDSIEAEKGGLKGTAYFDARWPKPKDEENKQTDFGYAFYDRSIHRAAEVVRKSGKMPVVLNEKEDLFTPGECPDAALYCGRFPEPPSLRCSSNEAPLNRVPERDENFSIGSTRLTALFFQTLFQHSRIPLFYFLVSPPAALETHPPSPGYGGTRRRQERKDISDSINRINPPTPRLRRASRICSLVSS
jgi:uncharacterized protein (TIGR03790 family)